MPKDDLVYLEHMLEIARKVSTKTQSIDRSAYDQDENLRLAVTHLLQIIGEAASRVSRDYRQAHDELEWARIISMRQKLVHDYMTIDDEIVWLTAKNRIPPLISALESILEP